MSLLADPEPAGDVDRFTPAQRALHWSVAALVLTCALTGLALYVGPFSAWVGRRSLVKAVHVYAGLALPLPLVVAYAGRWRAEIRRDLRRLARWTRADRRWLWSRGHEATGEVGKFNAGQKLNAAFVGGMIPVMLGTGAIMRWFEPFPLDWRTGATFVHDWTAIATWVVVAGHVLMALSNPQALRGIVVGRVARAWAADHHPRWAEAQRAETAVPPPTMAALVQEEGQPWTSASG
ncbi:MAG TPA: cytochrome b/b6 domain-containing protein [Acidimicrobiales bacterium]